MIEHRTYWALYRDIGGAPCGFQCGFTPLDGTRECGRVVRTQLGVRMHLLRVHGVREQLMFNFPDATAVEVKEVTQ